MMDEVGEQLSEALQPYENWTLREVHPLLIEVVTPGIVLPEAVQEEMKRIVSQYATILGCGLKFTS